MAKIEYTYNYDEKKIEFKITPSTPTIIDEDTLRIYVITDVYIDTLKTFVCKNEPSELAYHHAILDAHIPAVVKFSIDESALPCDDFMNELLFAFIKESYIDLTIETSGSIDSYMSWFNANIINEGTVESPLTYTEGTPSYYTLYEEVLTHTVVNFHYVFSVMFDNIALSKLILSNINIADNKDCNVQCSDVNTMLAWYGFNLANKLNDMKRLIYYWNLLHESVDMIDVSNCNCNR